MAGSSTQEATLNVISFLALGMGRVRQALHRLLVTFPFLSHFSPPLQMLLRDLLQLNCLHATSHLITCFWENPRLREEEFLYFQTLP